MNAGAELSPALLEKLLSGGLSQEQEKRAVEDCARGKPAAVSSLLAMLVARKHRFLAMYQEADGRAKTLARAIQEPPLVPATFLCLSRGGDRAMVAAGARRVSVGLAPDFDAAALRRGEPVLLNGPGNLLVRGASEFPRVGVIAAFSRPHRDGQAVLRGPAEEEFIVDLAEDLTGLAPGDKVLFDRESQIAWEKVEGRHGDTGLLEELPLDVRIEDLGGLDGLFDEIVREVKLHLFDPALAMRYGLEPSAGILFSGPPGTGKTSLARAVGAHLRRTAGVDLRAFLCPPGSHRSCWYGDTERRIRDIFRQIKDAARRGGRDGFALLLMDDFDHLGSRDHYGAGEIDARVLPCLLQEIDALKGERVLLIGATNREDVLDAALLRRFGRVFHFQRPDRAQAREIFRRHLTPDLEYADHGAPSEHVARELIEGALSAAYAPNGEFSALATLTFRDGSRRTVRASEVISGALIAGAAAGAKRCGCFRELAGGPPGITAGDLVAALARELDTIAARLAPGPALRTLLNLPNDLDVVRVEPCRTPGAPLRADYLEPV